MENNHTGDEISGQNVVLGDSTQQEVVDNNSGATQRRNSMRKGYCSDTSEILSDDTSNEKTQKVLSVPQTSSNQLPTTTHDCIHEIKQKNISSSMDNTIYSLVLYIENSLIWKATFLNKKTKKEENLFYILNVDGIDKVFCSICDGVMDEVSRNPCLATKKGKRFFKSTTNSINHLTSQHKEIYNKLITPKTKTRLETLLENNSQQQFNENLIKWIISSSRPFALVEDKYFKSLILSCNCNLRVPSRFTLINNVNAMYFKLSNELKSYFEKVPLCSFTCDVVTTKNHLHLLGITCHWIDPSSSKIRCMLLSLETITGISNGPSYFDAFKRVLDYYNLWPKLFCVTTDNGGGNSTFIDKIETFSIENGYYFSKARNWNRCAAHVINIAIYISNTFLYIFIAFLDIVKDQIEKIRQFGMHIRNSAVNLERFNEILKTITNGATLSFKDDVETRWNSTFYMIQRYLRLYSAVVSYSVQYNIHNYDLSNDDINLIQDILKVLALFENITVKLSGSSYPTLPQVLPYFLKLYDTLDEFLLKATHESLKSGIIKAKDMLLKYINKDSGISICSIIFEPHFKNYILKNSLLKSLEQQIISVSELYVDMYWIHLKSYYSNTNVSSMVLKDDDNETTSSPIHIGVNNEIQDISLRSKPLHTIEKDNPVSSSEKNNSLSTRWMDPVNNAVNDFLSSFLCIKDLQNGSELERYLAEPLLSANDRDIVKWWVTRNHDFPKLSCFALGLMMTPGTSVPIEQAFSGVNLTVSKLRSRLASKTINSAECLKSFIKNEDLFSLDSLKELEQFDDVALDFSDDFLEEL
ncbi:hypothetical protein WA158_006860 [Blastocystis sp. Blastoise]